MTASFHSGKRHLGLGLSRMDDSREGIAKFLKRNPTTSFVAESENGQIVGAILCGHDGRRALIHHTCVWRNYARRGIGEKLVTCALDALVKEGINKATLVVFTGNDVGNQFWQKMGFIRRDDLYYRNLALVNQND